MIRCKWGFAVVGAYILALIAAENPAVEVASFTFAFSLDSGARYAARCVDMSLFYSLVGARLYASATPSAADAHKGSIVLVELLGDDYLAEQYEGAKLGRYEQRLATNPAESRLDGIALFEDGCTIDKASARKGG